MKKLLIAVSLLISIAPLSLFAENAPKIAELPKVLIIGDSISIGYTPYVIKELEGKAVVKHHKGNAQYTGTGLKMLDEWIGETNWDIIHFNWGLWDMYGWPYAKEDRSPSIYEKRLDELVTRLEATGATLIWGTTTPVCPAPEKTMLNRFKTKVAITPAVERQYLDAALRVMEKHQIQVNDLHALSGLKEHLVAPNNVHFSKGGYKKLGKQVAEAIAKNLKGESGPGE